MLLTYLLSPFTTKSSPSAISCYSHTYCSLIQQILYPLPYHVTYIHTAAIYNRFNTICHIMLLTFVLPPVKTDSTPYAISCYLHSYCRLKQQIQHPLPCHVTHIRTVASYKKFLTLCHIMLLTYVLLPGTTNSSLSAISF